MGRRASGRPWAARPYTGSPRIGRPTCARWMRIWCWRPVSSSTSRSAAPGSALADAPVRAGLARSLARLRNPAAAAHPGLAQRRLHRPPLRRGLALDDREVEPLDPVVAEGADEPSARFPREGERDRSRGVPVEAVDALGVAPARLQAQGVVLDAPQRRVLIVDPGRRGHGQEAGRLVHDEDVLVFVKDAERAAGAREGLAVRVEGDTRALGDLAARLAHPRAVDAHLSLLDHLPRLPARQLRVAADQQQVEAHGYSRTPRSSSQAAGSWPK